MRNAVVLTVLCVDKRENFLDPSLTSDGKPYGPVRYKEIINERYLISKFCHTSYSDVATMTPMEREYLLSFILNDLQRERDAHDKLRKHRS